MDPRPISHDRARELALEAVDFELSGDEARALDDHLATCRPCRAFAVAAIDDQARLASLPRRPAPARILDAIRREEERRPGRIRPVLVIAALAVGGAFAVATLSGGSQPRPSPVAVGPTATPSLGSPTPSQAAPMSSPAPASIAPMPNVAREWTPVARQAPFHDPYGDMDALAVGARIVAVGDGCGANLPTCHAAVWTSDDGLVWQRVPDGPVFQVGPWTVARRGEMTDVVATPDGFVAVGRSREGGVRRAAAWWSNDGLRWSRSTDGTNLRDGTMESVVATPAGLVAVGNVVSGDVAAAGAWTSADGLSWEVGTAPGNAFAVGGRGTFTDGRIHGGMIDVVWTGTQLVAVGSACAGNGGCHGVAWTSDDGRTWRRATDAIDGTPYALSTDGGLLVAAGDDGRSHPMSWTSTDGSAWEPGRPVSGVDGNFDALTATPAGLVGTIAAKGLSSLVVTSLDGSTWQVAADRLALGPGVINDLAWDPVHSVVFGVGWDGRTPAAAAWVGR